MLDTWRLIFYVLLLGNPHVNIDWMINEEKNVNETEQKKTNE